MLARQLWTGELGNRKDIVCIRVAWCWRQTGGAREVMAYLVVHITISSIKDLSIYMIHSMLFIISNYLAMTDKQYLALPLPPSEYMLSIKCAMLPSPSPSHPICSTSDSQIKLHFRLTFLPSPLRKQHHVLIPSPVGKVFGGVVGGVGVMGRGESGGMARRKTHGFVRVLILRHRGLLTVLAFSLIWLDSLFRVFGRNLYHVNPLDVVDYCLRISWLLVFRSRSWTDGSSERGGGYVLFLFS